MRNGASGDDLTSQSGCLSALWGEAVETLACQFSVYASFASAASLCEHIQELLDSSSLIHAFLLYVRTYFGLQINKFLILFLL